MKKNARLMILTVFFTALLVSCVSKGGPSVLPLDSGAGLKDGKRMNGVWLSVVSGNYPRAKSLDAEKLRSDCDFFLDEAEELGFNAIFFQVRPSCDALYKSRIFPWSRWIGGTQGEAPQDSFDPLEYFCSAAHARGIQIHAWINPYRIKAQKGQSLEDILKTNRALRSVKKFILPGTDGNFYLDPGEPRVRSLILKGAKEIVKNYDVDGLHLDDYFYPDCGLDDSASYAKYGKGLEPGDFRRESVNTLVKELGLLVHREKPGALFGISPFGIWANKSREIPGGSETRGSQSYYKHSADSLAWIERGLIDYIVPQIYWERGHKAADYEVLARWWNEAVEGSGVRLYIGIADYKAAAARENPESPWHGTAELAAQRELNGTLENVSGEIHFDFNSVLLPEIRAFYKSIAEGDSF